jgi:hypothetical protein
LFHFNSLARAALPLALCAAAVVAPISLLSAQQSELAVSPFMSFLPTAGASPLAGLALTLGNGPFAVRGGAHLSLENRNNKSVISSATARPWGADADLMLFLGGRGYRRTVAPYVFGGLGVSGSDSLTLRGTHNNWSYGGGLTVPVASAIEVFGEARWRMSRYVLPTASLAPNPTHEFRVGVSFHVGNSSHGNRESARGHYGDATFTTPPRFAVSIPSSTSTSTTTQLVNIADDYLGEPYRAGGASPTTGFDASGFTQYVFARQGVHLPRTAEQQGQVGLALPSDWSVVKPGDLVLFREADRIDHVAIYAGNNRIIHSSASGGGVRYDDLGTVRGEWFVDHMVALRRVAPNGDGVAVNLAQAFELGTPRIDGPDHAPKPE